MKLKQNKHYNQSLKSFLFIIGCLMSIGCMQSHQEKRPHQIALTIDDIHNIIVNDTSHYKVFIFYNPLCEPCFKHLHSTYAKAVKENDTNKVAFYFILDKYNPAIEGMVRFDSLGVSFPLYYLNDDRKVFSPYNTNRWNNIANALFGNDVLHFEDLYGVPVNFIVNKQGTVKSCIHSYDDTLFRQTTSALYDIDCLIQDVNFLKQDTIILHFEAFQSIQ